MIFRILPRVEKKTQIHPNRLATLFYGPIEIM